MANTVIQIKKSATPSAAPTDLANGELAINFADGIIYYKHANLSIASLSSGGPSFGTVDVDGTLVVADTNGDILTLLGGPDITLVADPTSDTIRVFANNISRAFDKANTANSDAIAAFVTANIAYSHANAAFDKANTSGGASVEVSTVAPGSPTANSVWWNSNLGKFFIYYDDGDTSQWVEAHPGTVLSGSTGDADFSGPYGHANLAYAKANTANITADLAYGKANTANNDAISAFIKANTAGSDAVAAFLTANQAFAQGNTGWNHANAAFLTANQSFAHANAAFLTANQSFSKANTANSDAIAAFLTANVAWAHANASFLTANQSFAHANAGFLTANQAFAKANTANSDAIAAFVTANQAFSKANSANVMASNVSINFVIDGGGSAITNGQKGHLEIPFAVVLDRWTILLDQSGSISLEVWKDSYANFPPTNADTINTDPYTVTSATKNTGSTLGTSSTINAGDILAYNVISAATATRATIALRGKKV